MTAFGSVVVIAVVMDGVAIVEETAVDWKRVAVGDVASDESRLSDAEEKKQDDRDEDVISWCSVEHVSKDGNRFHKPFDLVDVEMRSMFSKSDKGRTGSSSLVDIGNSFNAWSETLLQDGGNIPPEVYVDTG